MIRFLITLALVSHSAHAEWENIQGESLQGEAIRDQMMTIAREIGERNEPPSRLGPNVADPPCTYFTNHVWEKMRASLRATTGTDPYAGVDLSYVQKVNTQENFKVLRQLGWVSLGRFDLRTGGLPPIPAIYIAGTTRPLGCMAFYSQNAGDFSSMHHEAVIIDDMRDGSLNIVDASKQINKVSVRAFNNKDLIKTSAGDFYYRELEILCPP